MQHPELQVLTIRFVGEQLKKQGLPIYELGLAFVAVQRIVNKAFLALEKRLDKGSFPNRREREILALQIACYEKRSDFLDWVSCRVYTIHRCRPQESWPDPNSGHCVNGLLSY
jgi:hypothetical protein